RGRAARRLPEPHGQDALSQGRCCPVLRRGRGDDGPGASRRHRAPGHGDGADQRALMSTAAVMLRLPARPRLGPALRRPRLPLTSMGPSPVSKAGLMGPCVRAASYGQSEQSKPYIITLVPAAAAVGTPQGRRAEPTPIPRPPEPAPPAPRTAPPELPT